MEEALKIRWKTSVWFTLLASFFSDLFFVIKAKHGRLFEINRLSLFKLAGFEIYFLSEDISGAMSKSSRRHQIISRDAGLLDWRKMVRTQKPPRERDLHYKSTWLNQTCSSHVWCPHSFICLNFLKTDLWNWMTFYQVIYWRDFFQCGKKNNWWTSFKQKKTLTTQNFESICHWNVFGHH